jgi:hypothetical protein
VRFSTASSQKGSLSARNTPREPILPHCRICGYAPRPPKPGQPDYSWEKIVDHMESRHPEWVYEAQREFGILRRQETGDDSQCCVHCGAQP